jgi:zinc protease
VIGSRKTYKAGAGAAVALLLSAGVFAAGKTHVDIKTRPWYHYIEEKMPAPKIPEIRRFNLKNSIPVYFLQAGSVPLIHMQVYVEGGAYEVPADQLGAHGLWGESVVYSGSDRHDRKELSQYLEHRASTFKFSAGLERSAFTLTSLANYFARDVETTFEVLNAPHFAQEDFELLKTRVLRELDRRDENPGKWASLGMTKMYWGDTLRGRLGTTKTVTPLRRENLVAWQKHMWRGERLLIAVAGAIDEATLKASLEKTYGTLAVTKKNVPDAGVLRVKPTVTPNDLKILPKDIPQTTVIYRAPGMRHGDPDYYALKIYDFLLGGDSFNSYLTQKIRTEKGWAYGAYSTFETDDFTGSLMLFTQTANVNLPDVVAAIDEILTSPSDFVTPKRIEQAKLSLQNKFVFLFENPTQYLKLRLQLMWDGLPDNYLAEYSQHLSRVTEADVLRVAQKYYRPENFAILLCGPPDVYQKRSKLRPVSATELHIEK